MSNLPNVRGDRRRRTVNHDNAGLEF